MMVAVRSHNRIELEVHDSAIYVAPIPSHVKEAFRPTVFPDLNWRIVSIGTPTIMKKSSGRT
jgi:hypothetical protein